MNWTLSDRNIEKILLTTSLLTVLTLCLEAMGFSQGSWSVPILLLFCYALSCFSRMHSRQGAREFASDFWADISFWGFLFFGMLSLLFYFTESTGNHSISNPDINGDWPMHLNQILFLSKTKEFWPMNPILGAEPLRYAFGINWFTALFLKAGWPLQFLILLTGSVSLLMTASLLKNSFGSWGLWAFFASGGGWGFSQSILAEAWGPASQLAWKNLFLAVYLPQRGFWWALPCGLYLLKFLFGFWQERKLLSFPWGFVVLWALLPLFHLHTFVAISAFVLITVLNQKSWFSIFKFLPGLPVALFFIWKSVNSENAQGSLHWSTGWMTGNSGQFFSLVLNLGPWLMTLLVVGIFLYLKKGQRFVFSAVFLCALFFNYFILAPWNWDQIKIFLWMYLALSYFMAREIQEKAGPTGALVLILILHSAGFFQLMGGWPGNLRQTTLWSLVDQNSVRQLLQEIPVEERVLIAPQPHHPIWSSGRAVVSGYEGHLWAHGVNIEGLKDSLPALFNGQQIQSLRFSKLSAKYLLWGPLEKTWFSREVPPEAIWIREKSVGDYSLYLRSPQAAP